MQNVILLCCGCETRALLKVKKKTLKDFVINHLWKTFKVC